ncbi:MAG: hypothetical protein GF411_14130 [Candidatus Lokiarchaeota archaeon]|nr:hypothetical protein [Candidatus Lokiarchaeota archaeon]
MKKIRTCADAVLIGSSATHFWFPDFRLKDYDFYAYPSFIGRFLKTNPSAALIKQHKSIKYYELNGQSIDIVCDTGVNGIGEIVDANCGSAIIELFGLKVLVAKPTTLLLIKKLYSCTNSRWHKNLSDYMFLKENVMEEPSRDELAAITKRTAYMCNVWRGKNNRRFTPEDVINRLEHSQDRVADLYKIVKEADFNTNEWIRDNIDRLREIPQYNSTNTTFTSLVM